MWLMAPQTGSGCHSSILERRVATTRCEALLCAGVHGFTISRRIKKNDGKRQNIPNASKKRFQYGEHLTYEPLASKMSHLSHF